MRLIARTPILPTTLSSHSLTQWSALAAWVIMTVSSVVGQPAASTAAADTFDEATDGAFVNEIEHRAVRYFVEQTDAQTGLTRDRAAADGGENSYSASIAATGFALTGWCIGDAHGWLPRGEALARTRVTLRFVLQHVAQEHGWIYHFLDPKTGARAMRSEASTIDTALFLSGALSAREYFDDAEVRQLVNAIYARVDWEWALNGGTTLTHGWNPETGFIPWRWDRYSELMGLYLLGIGAPGKGLPPETWNAWRREPVVKFAGRTFVDCGPLFTHQYAHAWFDFRDQRDDHIDYWHNSIDATLAQREWSAQQSSRFPRWSHELWGLTASDSARGYVAWGGPGGKAGATADGTVVPCAPGGSLPFAPRECLASLRRMREIGGDKVWRRYGFVDAFNPQTGWASPDVIGIDLGITLLMAENMQSGLVWKTFMKAPEVRLGMWLAGFRSEVSPELPVQARMAAAQ